MSSADRYWVQHCPRSLQIDDAGIWPDTAMSVDIYAMGRSHPKERYPFAVHLSIDSAVFRLSSTMTPATARKLAAALLSAAADVETRTAELEVPA